MVLVGVLASLAASLLAFAWGACKTAMVVPHIYESVFGQAQLIRVELIAIMDIFLIAVALYMFAVGFTHCSSAKSNFPHGSSAATCMISRSRSAG
jgi:uncharacterized membrane protein YqhA